MSGPRTPWEPDERKLGNWASMFDPKGRDEPAAAPPIAAHAESYDDAEVSGIDPHEYRPWILQRGQSRGSMMLALRWFDAKGGLWHSSALAYPSLYAIDTIADRMVSLDFGARQIVLEGRGLDELTRHLQQGTVQMVVEYAAPVWPTCAEGPVVTAIRRMTGD